MKKKSLIKIFDLLFERYGPQGWWPYQEEGYHPGKYCYPQNDKQRFEMAVGAILTQNTNWTQVEKVVERLYCEGVLDARTLGFLPVEELEEWIRPAGYFRQKTKKLQILAHAWPILVKKSVPTREELLALWGVGPETADSILLYGFQVPIFVVDAYTKRILGHLGYCDEKASYQEIQDLFMREVKQEVWVYQEYHALLVEHGKHFYSRKPYGEGGLLGL